MENSIWNGRNIVVYLGIGGLMSLAFLGLTKITNVVTASVPTN